MLHKQQDKKQRKYEELLAKSLKKRVDEKEAAEGFDTWYVCDDDACHKPINPGHYRFDCLVCHNFTFCERCYKKNTKHVHKFKRIKNQGEFCPPDNADELIQKSYMLCHECKDSLIDVNKRVFICKECSPDIDAGDAVYWCKKCKESTEHEHKREKYRGLVDSENAEKDKIKGGKLDSLLQEYYDLDCEDIIGGGKIKTRFKYKTVAKEDFGLTEEEIFLLDDRQLNQLVSMKKLRPYRHLDDFGQPLPEDVLRKQKVNVHKVIKKKQAFKDELEYKRKLVRENQQASLQMEKDQFFGTQAKISKAERKQEKLDKKNKNAKYVVSK